MKVYRKQELERFLEAVDAASSYHVDVIVIGAAAAALHHGVRHGPRDVDTWTTGH